MAESTLEHIVRYAFDSGSYQIMGLPRTRLTYSIEAIAAESATEGDIRRMLQELLINHFALKAHRETREMLVYELTVSPNGHRLKEAKQNATPSPGGDAIAIGTALVTSEPDGLHLFGLNANVAQLANAVSTSVQRAVLDVTGISGRFDFDVLHAREESKDGTPRLPELETAIEEVPCLPANPNSACLLGNGGLLTVATVVS